MSDMAGIWLVWTMSSNRGKKVHFNAHLCGVYQKYRVV